jgi:hypothetical protein
MKKSIMIFAILVLVFGIASAQGIKPFRLGLGMDGVYVGELSYAFPINATSLAITGGVGFSKGFGWIGRVSFYPFSSVAKGWYGSVGVSSAGYTDLWVSAGYQFLFWDWLSLQLALNVGYSLDGTTYPGTGSSFSFPPSLVIGIAF